MNEPEYRMGIEFIGEMSREDIITELLEAQRVTLEQRSLTGLKAELIQLRLAILRHKWMGEAGLKEGLMGIAEEDDNE